MDSYHGVTERGQVAEDDTYLLQGWERDGVDAREAGVHVPQGSELLQEIEGDDLDADGACPHVPDGLPR